MEIGDKTEEQGKYKTVLIADLRHLNGQIMDSDRSETLWTNKPCMDAAIWRLWKSRARNLDIMLLDLDNCYNSLNCEVVGSVGDSKDLLPVRFLQESLVMIILMGFIFCGSASFLLLLSSFAFRLRAYKRNSKTELEFLLVVKMLRVQWAQSCKLTPTAKTPSSAFCSKL